MSGEQSGHGLSPIEACYVEKYNKSYWQAAPKQQQETEYADFHGKPLKDYLDNQNVMNPVKYRYNGRRHPRLCGMRQYRGGSYVPPMHSYVKRELSNQFTEPEELIYEDESGADYSEEPEESSNENDDSQDSNHYCLACGSNLHYLVECPSMNQTNWQHSASCNQPEVGASSSRQESAASHSPLEGPGQHLNCLGSRMPAHMGPKVSWMKLWQSNMLQLLLRLTKKIETQLLVSQRFLLQHKLIH